MSESSVSSGLSAADRSILREVMRWVRANGWQRGHWEGEWVSADGLTMVCTDYGVSRGLAIRRRQTVAAGWSYGGNPARFVNRVGSVREAVDVLVALGVLPAEFSSAFDAGYDANGQDLPKAYREGHNVGYRAGYLQGRHDDAAGGPLPTWVADV